MLENKKVTFSMARSAVKRREPLFTASWSTLRTGTAGSLERLVMSKAEKGGGKKLES